MEISPASIPDVLVLEPRVFEDERGFFLESYNKRIFQELSGFEGDFVQDNHSRSGSGVLRGMHYQLWQPQGKLIRVTQGAIFDVAVDLRRSSSTFGSWAGIRLSDANRRQCWIPPGFAHGFYVLSDHADVLYKTTSYYLPEAERSLAWDDSEIGIDWPLLNDSPLLSAKDRNGASFSDCEKFD